MKSIAKTAGISVAAVIAALVAIGLLVDPADDAETATTTTTVVEAPDDDPTTTSSSSTTEADTGTTTASSTSSTTDAPTDEPTCYPTEVDSFGDIQVRVELTAEQASDFLVVDYALSVDDVRVGEGFELFEYVTAGERLAVDSDSLVSLDDTGADNLWVVDCRITNTGY